MENPLVSIIIRTLNRPQYLRECLWSVARQEYHKLEVVLVNDGGPSVKALCKEFSGIKINLIELSHNFGRSECGNLGFKNSVGNYVCLLDDDDIFYPDHLSTLIQHAKQNLVVYSDALEAQQIPSPWVEGTYLTKRLMLRYSSDFSRERIVKENFIPIQCPLIPIAAIRSGKIFDTNLDTLEDWDFWISLSRDYNFKHIPEITSEYRYRSDSTNTVGQLGHLWNWSRKYLVDKHNLSL